MHVEQALGPRSLVKIVDILGDDQKLSRPFRVEPGKRAMGGVGFDLSKPRPPGVVELMNQRRITDKGFRRGDILDPMPLPQPVGSAERRQAALRADSGAGQDDDVADLAHAGQPSRSGTRVSPSPFNP